MVLTRAQNQPGPDGVIGDDPTTPQDESADDIQNANNTDSPWVDQSQTYTSHAVAPGVPARVRHGGRRAGRRRQAAGRHRQRRHAARLTRRHGPCYNDGNATDGNISTWAAVKQQAAQKLGLLLKDKDVTDIPMLATDPYGEFIPAANGLPQYVCKTADNGCGTDLLLPGDLANPVAVPANVRHFDTPFLTDIAHNADPSPQDTDNNPATPPVAPVPDADTTASADFANQPLARTTTRC